MRIFSGKYLNIIREEPQEGGIQTEVFTDCPKLAWCPYIAEDGITEGNDNFHLLAMARGNTVSVYSLHLIKAALSRLEVKYDQASEIPGAVLTVECEADVAAVKLSPDGTAVSDAGL